MGDNWPNIPQIRDYVLNDKPIASNVARDWLKFLLEQNHEMSVLLQEVSELLSWRDRGSGQEEALRKIYDWVFQKYHGENRGGNHTDNGRGPEV